METETKDQQVIFDHVAFVVPSLKTALELVPQSISCGPIEEFPSEGTRECYVGELLLLEPIADGPYASALGKRGAGLHHLGVNVPDIDVFLDTLDGSGWYLHPSSFRTRAAAATVWLARPGVGALVEVHESDANHPAKVVESVRVNGLDARTSRLFAHTGTPVINGSPSAVKLRDAWFPFDPD